MSSINISTMGFCPPNVTFSNIWIDHGISKCFMDTISTSIIFLYLIIFGSVQIWMYHKYSNEVYISRKSKLYNLQKFLLYLVPILSIVRIICQATILDDGKIYGYMILTTVLTVIVYPYSIYILKLERHRLLPSVTPSGHGLVLLGFWTLAFVAENLILINIEKLEWWFHLNSVTDQIEMALFILRYICSMLIFGLGLRAPGIVHMTSDRDIIEILNDINNLQTRYYRERIPDNVSTWKNLWYKIKILAPFLWPKSNFWLQLKVMFCILLLLCGRLINLYVPIYNKKIVDSITIVPMEFRWDLILIYVAFKFLQGGGTGGMGLLNNLRSFLWIRIQQYTTREVEIELFKHLHGLSLRWHLGRKTGEVLRVMDRGTDSINNLLNYILFSIFPTIVDIIVAVLFFVSAFNKWFGLIVFITMILYIAATIMVTEWRTKFQRYMNLADNKQKARSVDSLLNFETVKYFNNESYEVSMYKLAIFDFQNQEWKAMITLNILNTLQNIIVCGGLLSGSLLCLHMIVSHEGLTIGDYVLFASYITQLYVPLNWFGTYYRAIQKNFVDMENMFDLFREEQEVIDAPGAEILDVEYGQVEFSNVSFGYTHEKLVLKNISFVAPPGKTIAIVGPSGAGKSTIMRLLFRFYDVEQGEILIDGRNVKTVTQESLRNNIGIVPQDTVLFNNTIRYNIHYGNLFASEADLIAAAKYADIHERILTFPNEYETEVGERGLKLSGGEKQRVAIARTILKDPKIVLLDEATSALDTHTERNIQAALNRVCAGRTTIIIAHRLSTIIHADEILVLNEGEIIERGKHEELISLDTVYRSMWQSQLENNLENKNETSSTHENNVLINKKNE
ncbi:hypothetical protein PUN28_017568 [Cardiocondyla obscurior]